MKKIIVLVLTLMFTAISFAQKNEIKTIEKALKNLNFSDAKSAVSTAEALIGSMDNKIKAKFYFLKAKALYANGAGTDANVDDAIKSLDDLKNLESSMGKLKYTEQVNEMKSGMLNSFLTKAQEAFKNKNYNAAAKRFDKAHKMSPKDTLYLYYAASAAVSDQDYDNALKYYLQLKNMNYTGVQMNYYATSKETGEEEAFNDKSTRDFSVKAKLHNNPRDVKSESKISEIVRNIALIYVTQGKNENALAAMADARVKNPDDIGLLLSEANIHLKMGNRDKFKILMEEAVKKDPNNAELLYNLGVLAAEGNDKEGAKKYYKKAIALDSKYIDAYNNLAFLALSEEKVIVEEMNSLGSSSADNRRYDELKEKRTQLYKQAIPYLEKSLSLKENIDTITNLMNLYSVIGETEKYKTLKARKEQMKANASGGN